MKIHNSEPTTLGELVRLNKIINDCEQTLAVFAKGRYKVPAGEIELVKAQLNKSLKEREYLEGAIARCANKS